MGLKMSAFIRSGYLRQAILAFTGMPLLFWAMGNLPARSFLKESISVIAIIAFCQMIGQFFMARTNRYAKKDLKMSRLIQFHKILGYACVTVLLFHPFFLVLPKLFESGVGPVDAFIMIITTLNRGVVLGIIAWCLVLVLGITSLLRKKMPMKYTSWRFFHGILAMLFISIATWHVTDLGRHSSLAMSAFIILLATGGVLLLLKRYISEIFRKTKEV